uniref:hypothetical protein n=1 Tax=Mycoplasma zalophidermidis TaxID=398174 RepID=UPI00358DF298
MSKEERFFIQKSFENHMYARFIARELKRSASSISREIKKIPVLTTFMSMIKRTKNQKLDITINVCLDLVLILNMKNLRKYLKKYMTKFLWR